MSRFSIRLLIISAATLLLGVPRIGLTESEDSSPAVIHFAGLGGIRDWRPADDGDALYIEGRNGMWYRATFMHRCPEIRFEETLAFVTDATGDLTSFSSVIAGDQRCFFRSLERTTDPAERPGETP